MNFNNDTLPLFFDFDSNEMQQMESENENGKKYWKVEE